VYGLWETARQERDHVINGLCIEIFCKSLVLYTNRDPFIRVVANYGFTVLQLKNSFLSLKLIQPFITFRSILQILYVKANGSAYVLFLIKILF
jgi:hypothetical protein